MINKQGWEKKKLGDICETTSGGTPNRSKREYFEGNIPWVKSGELDKGLIIDTEEKITEEALRNSSAKLFPKGTLLIALYGATIGKLAFLGIDACTNQAICGIFKNDKIDSEFLYYFLLYKKPSLINKGVGGGQPNISQAIIKNLILPIPSVSIQQQIVSELYTLSSIINKKKQQLEELDKLAQATFYDMFGDPVSNEKGWEVKKLGNICDVGSSRRVFVNELVESGIPFYRGTEVGQLGVGKEINPELFITDEHYKELKKQCGVPQIGDLLMPSICPDGRIYRVNTNQPFYFKDGRVLWIKVDNKKINSIYLKSLLKEIFFSDYSSIASGSTFAELKIFALKDIKLPLATLREQNKYALKIESIENQKALINKSIDDVQLLFDYTMDKYFN
jgi:type I restriction enzyme, S subunit